MNEGIVRARNHLHGQVGSFGVISSLAHFQIVSLCERYIPAQNPVKPPNSFLSSGAPSPESLFFRSLCQDLAPTAMTAHR
jgi:hypothetical protein